MWKLFVIFSKSLPFQLQLGLEFLQSLIVSSNNEPEVATKAQTDPPHSALVSMPKQQFSTNFRLSLEPFQLDPRQCQQ